MSGPRPKTLYRKACVTLVGVDPHTNPSPLFQARGHLLQGLYADVMPERELPLSVRSLLQQWLLAVVLVFVVVALAGGYLTYDGYVTEPETVVEQRNNGTWTVESGFEHSALVQRETDVFQSGTRLQNRSLYFTTVTPDLDVNYTIANSNTDGRSATGSVDLSLVIRAAEERDGREVVYWETREQLETLDAVDIEAGTEESTAVSVDVPEVVNRTQTIQQELGSSPGNIEILIRAETTIEGAVGSETFTDTRTDRLRISPSGSVYRVTPTVEDQQSYPATTQVTRQVEPPALSLYGGPMLLLIGLTGVAALVFADREGKLAITERERERKRYRAARTDFDEWISTVEIPAAGERTVARAETLPDLVDVAIDSERAVLEDGDRYAVLVDDVMYTYTAPADETVSEEIDDPDDRTPQGNDESEGTDRSDTRESPETGESVLEERDNGDPVDE